MSIHFAYPDPLTEDTAENRLKHTFYLVEADSFAQHALWCEFSPDSLYPPYDIRKGKRAYEPVHWEQCSMGWSVQVGSIKVGRTKMPVCISVSWYRIEGRWVCFWYSSSMVTDGRMAEKWLKKHFARFHNGPEGRAMQCDAMNFAHCLRAIEEVNKVVV